MQELGSERKWVYEIDPSQVALSGRNFDLKHFLSILLHFHLMYSYLNRSIKILRDVATGVVTSNWKITLRKRLTLSC